MPTLDATKSGPAANTYMALDDLDAAMDEIFLADEWAETDEATRQRIAITATKDIDRLTTAYPKFDDAQARSFPVNIGTEDEPVEAGWDAVRRALVHQALYLMRFGETLVGQQEEAIQGMKSQSLGKVSTTKGVAGFNTMRKYAPDALREIAEWLSLGMTISRG